MNRIMKNLSTLCVASAAASVQLTWATVISGSSLICIAGVCSIGRLHHNSLPCPGVDGYLHPSQSLASVNYLLAYLHWGRGVIKLTSITHMSRAI